MNKKLLTSVIGAALTVAGPAAFAIEGKVSGQINRAVLMGDDGFISETRHVDNSMSGSRFRFTGSADLASGIKAGINYEMEFLSNSSGAVTLQPGQTNITTGVVTGGNNPQPINVAERIEEVYFQGAFGKLSVGQGLGAGDGGAEVDLSGTSVVTGTLSHNLGGAIRFRTGGCAPGDFGGCAISGNPSLSSTLNNQDFEGRLDRVRYDSPALGPVTIAGSFGQVSSPSGENTNADNDRNVRELAVWVNSDLGGAGKIAGVIAYTERDSAVLTFDRETKGGSFSWLAPFGLNVTVAYTKQNKSDTDDTREGDYKYLKVGYKMGEHAFSVDLTKADDQAANGDEAKRTGIGYNWAPKPWADVYAGYHINSLDRPGLDIEDITVLTIGSRLKF